MHILGPVESTVEIAAFFCPYPPGTHDLVVLNNEVGFVEDDVRRLCDVGNSKKSAKVEQRPVRLLVGLLR